MEKLVVGVIGVQMGWTHLKGLQKYGAEIGAICDCIEERLNKVGDEFNIPAEKRYLNWHDVANNPEINVVLVVTPDQLHREMVEEFLAKGKHVMCEKPLALTREDLSAIIAAEKKAKTRFMVGQICRVTPSFVKAKEIVESGAIGELYFVESEYAHDYMEIMQDPRGAWRLDPRRHGMIGGGCHAVDLLRWIAGDPIEVFGYGSHKLLPMVEYDDAAVAVMKFPNGVIGKVFASTGCKRGYTMRTCLYGTKGTIICDNTSDHLEIFRVDENDKVIKPAEIIPIEVNNHNTEKEFASFADAIENNKPILMTAMEGAKTVATCMAIVESTKTGMPTKPDYNF